MSEDENRLPESFEVVVLGTGVTESIVSAAVSRNGHSVLHMDPREYYGGSWATLHYDSWVYGEFALTPNAVPRLPDGFSHVKLQWSEPVRDFDQHWYVQRHTLKDEFRRYFRKFNIDVLPRVILAREEIVDLLIKSNVSRYLEFLRVGKLLASLPPPSHTVIESIPLSRSDIFTSKSVGLVEKRNLVKFIEAILKPPGQSETPDDQPGASNQPTAEEVEMMTFEEMAESFRLTPKVRHLIKAAVETLEDGFSQESGIAFDQTFVSRCKKFLQSIGRFGNQTPYLWTLYGISEICQAFCRLSAVYGGLFILKRYISSLEEVEDGVKIVSEKDEFKAKYLVIGPEMEYIKHPDFARSRKVAKTVGRGVLITKYGSIKAQETKPGSKADGIFLYKIDDLEVIEMNHLSQAVLKDYRLLQVSFAVTDSGTTSTDLKRKIEETLEPFVNFHPPQEANPFADPPLNDPSAEGPSNPPPVAPVDSKPHVMYGSYFLLDIFAEDDTLYRRKKGTEDPTEHMHGKILSCATGSTEITLHVEKAREIFERMFPGEEFLPTAPDMPEDMEENGVDVEHVVAEAEVLEQEEEPEDEEPPEDEVEEQEVGVVEEDVIERPNSPANL